MTLKDFLRCGLLAAVLALAGPAVASNISFMKDTPYAHFTQEDHKIFNEALNNILNSGADGETQTWSNPTSKAGGELKVVKSFERKGIPCRTLSIANKARDAPLRENTISVSSRPTNGSWPSKPKLYLSSNSRQGKSLDHLNQPTRATTAHNGLLLRLRQTVSRHLGSNG